MADTFKNVMEKDGPADRWFLITATTFAILPRGIFCAGEGDITMEDAQGTAMTLTAVPAFTLIPVRPTEVTAVTGTFYGLY